MKANLFYLLLIIYSTLFLSCDEEETKIEAIDEDAFYQDRYHTIQAVELQKPYEIRVFLPLAYQENDKLPVIYIMEFTTAFHPDAQEFDKVINTIRKLKIDAIVVAGDKFDEDNTNFDKFESFHNFMKDELVPFIDANYKNNHDSRILLGRGTGAAHSLMTLLTETSEASTFQNYIVTDPPFNLGTEVSSMIAKDKFPPNKNILRLHISSSSKSNDWMQPLSETLKNKNYPWLTFGFKAFPEATFVAGTGHISSTESSGTGGKRFSCHTKGCHNASTCFHFSGWMP